jgi:hypothetical protein
VDSGRAISFVTLGTRDLPTLRSFYRSWGWTERDSGDDEFAQFDAGGVRLAQYPLGLLRDEAAPDSGLPAGLCHRHGWLTGCAVSSRISHGVD